MVANFVHFSQVDEQTTIQVVDYFLVNYVGWYRHFTVTDTGTNRDYVWISDGEPDRYENTNPRIIRLQSNGASNQLRFYAYSTFVDASTFTGEIFDATDTVLGTVVSNNSCWLVADKERVLLGISLSEDSSFAPAYFGRLDSFFTAVQDPYPNAVRGTPIQTEDWDESASSIQWFALTPSGTERRYKLLTATTTIVPIGRNPRNDEYFIQPQPLYTDATAGEFEIRGYPRGAYQVHAAAAHQTFITMASGVYMVFKGHQAGSFAENSAWAFGPLKDPRVANPFEMPAPYPEVDHKYQGFKLEENTYALWRMEDIKLGKVRDGTGMHHLTVVSGSGYVKSPMGNAVDLNGTTQYLSGPAPLAGTVLLDDWTAEISFYPDTIPVVSGTLLECGSVGDSPVNNTLLGISMVSGTNSGSDVTVYWDSTPSDRTYVTISGGYIDAARWNYLAVVKTTFSGISSLAVWHAGFGDHNPILVGTAEGLPTCSGGDNSKWYVGRTPESTSHYDGRIEEIKVSKKALDPSEIVSSFKRVRL